MGPTEDKPSGLGSLAQAARGNQLKRARNILIWIGALTLVVNAVFLAIIRFQVKAELDKEVQKARAQGVQVDPQEVQQIQDSAEREAYLVNGVAIFLGALFVVFGLVVKRYPVPVTITSFVLYVGATVVFGVWDPSTLMRGIIWKVIVVVALAKAIQAALAYQKEKDLAATVEPSYE